MGCNNYHWVNAYYTIDVDEAWIRSQYDLTEDDEIEDRMRSEEFNNKFEWSKERIIGRLNLINWWEDQYELRSYPSEIVWRINVEAPYKSFSVQLDLVVVSRSWYYDWVNFDYHFNLYVEWNRVDDLLKDLFNSLPYWLSDKEQEIRNERITKRYNKNVERLTKKVKKVLKECTDQELVKLWSMSNWEAVYKVV